MSFPTHGAAGQLVSKFMNQHDQEQRETFRHAPQQGRIAPRLMDEIGDRQKPRPVQIDGDAEKLEEPDGALARWHVGEVITHLLAANKIFGMPEPFSNL
jgi:hypothetical protein